MIKKAKIVIVALVLGVIFIAPAPVIAGTIKDSVCKGTNLSFSDAPLAQNAGESQEAFNQRKATASCSPAGANEDSLDALIAKIIDIISVIVGIIAVVMIIIGGFKYITSGGDSGKVTSAKNTIIYAIVGLVIVALAQFIVKFVLGQSSSLVP